MAKGKISGKIGWEIVEKSRKRILWGMGDFREKISLKRLGRKK